MGFDMQLYALARVDKSDPEKLAALGKIFKIKSAMMESEESVVEVRIQVAELCKAYSIHDWLVKNARCKEERHQIVSRQKLAELASVCRTALKDSSKRYLISENPYAIMDGRYMSWYLESLQLMADHVDKALADPSLKDFEFYYFAQ